MAELTKAVDAFDSATTVAHTNHLDHVGAHAALEAVANECVKQAGIMDGLNRARFADNPEMLAACISASKVVGPFHFRSTEPVAPPEPIVAPVPVVSPVPAPGPVASLTPARSPVVTPDSAAVVASPEKEPAAVTEANQS